MLIKLSLRNAKRQLRDLLLLDRQSEKAFTSGSLSAVGVFGLSVLCGRSDWKYRRYRLIPFRGFTAKIHSTSIVMGMLSILFLLAVTFGGVGSVIGLMVTKNIEAGAFDLMILHKGEIRDFSFYAEIVRKEFPAGAVTRFL